MKNNATATAVGMSGNLSDFIDEIDQIKKPRVPDDPEDMIAKLNTPIG
jgi:hypothetical protein